MIHWDLPTDSKTTFTLRFTFIRSEVRSIFSSATAQQVRVVLMLGSEDATSLSTIIPFLKRSGASIPDGLFYKAFSLTKANFVLVTWSPLNMTGSCTDKMEGGAIPNTSCMQSWTVLRLSMKGWSSSW